MLLNLENSCDNKMPAALAELPFGAICWALSKEAYLCLQPYIAKLPSNSLESILYSLQYSLVYRLSKILLPSLTIEMSLLSFTGHLKASDKKARYLEFVEFALTDAFLTPFFKRYPTLFESIETTIIYWKDSVIEFFERLFFDMPTLELEFGKKPRLLRIYVGLSDLHNKGRTVFQVEFVEFKLIYKPRDLSVEKAFNALLVEINSQGFTLPFKPLHVLNRGSYGWVEFVENVPCQSEAEVRNFYRRSGANLCLWYLLEGVDAHFENIISSGQYPIMVDIETLFHPEIYIDPQSPTTKDPFKNSVLRTGLLPFVGNHFQVNHGGITASHHNIIPESFVGWANVNTDTMQLVRKMSIVKSNKHLARLNEAPISFVHHIDAIYDGFGMMYHFFRQRKKHFANSEALEQLSRAKTRIVLRSTTFYSHLLQCLNLPVHAQSKEQAEEFLKKALYTYYHQCVNPSELQKKEMEQLLQHDVPYFYSFANSKNLYSADGHCFADFFSHSIAELVKEKIARLNKKEELKQRKILKNSLNCFVPKKRANENQLFKDSAIKVALSIADHLKAASIQHSDLYNGRAGIALFFAALYQATHDKKWARAALDLRRIDSSHTLLQYPSLCAFSGMASLLYADLLMGPLLGQTLNQPTLLKRCQPFAKQWGTTIHEWERLDFVGGLAGFICCLTCCYQTTGNKRVIELAHDSAKQLIGKFEKQTTYEIGLSHGLAGYAHALFRLGFLSKNEHYLNIARKMVDIEQGIYLTKEYQVRRISWCHGNTGIAISRLAHLSLYDNQRIRNELQEAVLATKQSLGDESSLCCGDFGRFEFLMEYAKWEKSYQLEMDVRQLLFLFMSEFIRTKGENCLLKEEYRWGFMQGIAGIGYSLLRLTGLAKLPQVLLLDK